jgi:hypothetical protein
MDLGFRESKVWSLGSKDNLYVGCTVGDLGVKFNA